MTTETTDNTDDGCDLERAIAEVLKRFGIPAYPNAASVSPTEYWPKDADRGDLESALADTARKHFAEHPASGDDEEIWGILELMGHVRTAGRLSEETRFGATMGRIDIPLPDGGFQTQSFGGNGVYRITYVSEEAARQVARGNRPAPIHRLELTAAPERSSAPWDRYENERDED